MRLITTAKIKLIIKPGTISYNWNGITPASVKLAQRITVTAPEIIPERAPHVVILRQNKLSRIIGPKEPPKPAQAYATKSKVVLSCSRASIAANIETRRTANLPRKTYSRSLPFLRNNTLYRSSTSALEVTINCEEIVLIIAARTAASKKPAISGWNTICPRVRKTASGLLKEYSGFFAKKAIPINAVAIVPSNEKIIHAIPIRRALLVSLIVVIAINRTMIWG